VKKLLFVILVSTFLFITCDNGDMENEKETNPYPDGVYPFEVSNVQHIQVIPQLSITWDTPTDNNFSHVIFELYHYTAGNPPLEFKVYPLNKDEFIPKDTCDNPKLEKKSFTCRTLYIDDKKANIRCVDKFGNKSIGISYNIIYDY